ncbi:MAG: two-component regulator propeller domain-containing protein, partial [Chitinophagaceae bacterium]
MKKINHLAPLFFLLILNTYLYPQNPFLKHYTKNDGLPSATIYQTIQDKDGFLWFGTDVGVTRFDGKKFQNYTVSDGLSDNHILVVKTDSKGRIWFLGDNGTVSYWLKGKIYNADNDTVLQQIKSSNAFVDLFEENENRLWFISMYEHIILDNHSITRIKESSVERAGMILSGTAGPIIVTPKPPFFKQCILGEMHALKLHYTMMWQSRILRLQDGAVLFISPVEGVVWQNDTIQKLIFPIHNAFYDIILGNMALTKDSLLWITVTGKGLFCYDLKNKNANPVIYFKDQITTG